jgi:hypothetical protein
MLEIRKDKYYLVANNAPIKSWVNSPNGFLFPPVTPADKTIGRIGQIHGANIVTMPERNVKKSKTNIMLYIHFMNNSKILWENESALAPTRKSLLNI